jgi:hypothetical protein
MKIKLLLIVVFLFLSSISWAGEYMLEKGKGVEVCEAYSKNLNSFNLHSQYVMACERKINPIFADFKKPEWEKLELRDN